VRHLIDDVTDLMADAARRKRLHLTATIDPQIPARLRGDPGRLRQVLTNLVSNAIKFTERGVVAIGVSLDRTEAVGEAAGPAAPGHRLYFEVLDTGIGIPPEVRGRLFQAFAQADGSM